MTAPASPVRMQAVVEPPWLGEWAPPWPVAEVEPGRWIVLTDASTLEEVGLVAAQLVRYNHAPAKGSAASVLRRVAQKRHPVLPGGIRVVDASGNAVDPGCCCGLEGWREWLDVADGRTSPWMGHDPWGWVEHEPDGVRVCSAPEAHDAGRAHGPATATVWVPRAELPRLLEGVRADLRGFAARLREWGEAIDPEIGARLAERFETAFVIDPVSPLTDEDADEEEEGEEEETPPRLSIIVPTLNEAAGIADTLAPLQPLRARGHEVIVVDGGSADGTPDLARPLADLVLTAERGRARQQNAGAATARGEVLLFLHADTRLPEGADDRVLGELERTGRGWGRFDVRLTGRHPMLRVIERMIGLRSRVSGIATGDQAIFVRRDWLARAGGFPDVPLMEDVALSRALRCLGPPLSLRDAVTTSSRRWEERGVFRTMLLMWRLRWAYSRGADPADLAERYR